MTTHVNGLNKQFSSNGVLASVLAGAPPAWLDDDMPQDDGYIATDDYTPDEQSFTIHSLPVNEPVNEPAEGQPAGQSARFDDLAPLEQTLITAIRSMHPILVEQSQEQIKRVLHSFADEALEKMTPDRWRFIKPYLLEVLDVPTLETFFLEMLEKEADPFPFLTWDDLMAMKDKEWMIDQLVGRGDLGVIFGPPGGGKTMVVVDLIADVTLGRPWAGRFGCPHPMNVVYCAGEGVAGCKGRFDAAAKLRNIDRIPNFTFIPAVPQLCVHKMGDFVLPAGLGKYAPAIGSVIQLAEKWLKQQEAGKVKPLDLLVIDTLSMATIGMNENDNGEMAMVAFYCRMVANMLNCAVIILHHSNRASTGERGASALRGAADLMIELSKHETMFMMACSKLKDGEMWKEQLFDIHKVEGTSSAVAIFSAAGEVAPVTASKEQEHINNMFDFMKRNPDARSPVKALGDVAGIAQAYAARLLANMAKDGMCESGLQDPSKPNSNRNPITYYVRS